MRMEAKSEDGQAERQKPDDKVGVPRTKWRPQSISGQPGFRLLVNERNRNLDFV